MNWNAIYHTYEDLALMVITTIWGMILLEPAAANTADYQSINGQLESVLLNTFEKGRNSLEALCYDVELNGNSLEGLDRIKRAEELNQRFNKVQKNLNQIREQTNRENLNDAVLLFNKQIEWINQEFNDLQLPHFEKIMSHDPFGYYSINSTEATEILLLAYQLKIDRYKHQVLRKLGAGDLTSIIRCGPFEWYPYIIPHSYIVQVGDEYTADIFDESRRSELENIKFFIDNQLVTPKESRYLDYSKKTQSPGIKHINLTIQYRNGYKGKPQSIEKVFSYTVIPK